MSAPLTELVAGRLAAWPPLAGPGGLAAIEEAAAFASLVERGGMPPRTPCAFVLPAGEEAGPQQVGTMIYRQRVTETVAVVLVTRGADRRLAAARETVTALREAVLAALLAWCPGAGWTPLIFRRSRLASLQGGGVTLTADYSSSRTIQGPAPMPAPDPEPDPEP